MTKLLRRCGDCQFFDTCLRASGDLDENETFAEIGGCKTFQVADDKTRQDRKVIHNITKYMKEKQ